MSSRRRSNEPIFWSLFGAGGVLTAFCLPALVLVTGVLGPRGGLGAGALDYDRVVAFATHPVGLLALVALISLTLFHAAHRIHHSLHDLGIKGGRKLSMVACYGFAAAASFLTLASLLDVG